LIAAHAVHKFRPAELDMKIDTPQSLVAAALAVALLVGLVALLGFRPLAATRWGRAALLVAIALLPISVSLAGLEAGVEESSRTRFCLSCHEMKDHGRSLFVDDRQALAAVHYQNRLIDRDRVCYACHTDYALFGDVKAKLAGLRHVWVHYFGTVPERFSLYQPYKNANCLHCHEDARRFVESAPHQGILPKLAAEETSCLSCHRVTHDLAEARAGELWEAN
jgi:cytochrome c-type protein NapC